MYIIETKTEQGSALREGSVHKRVCELLEETFLTNILSNVVQNIYRKYMQGAHKIRARYRGVVVWK